MFYYRHHHNHNEHHHHDHYHDDDDHLVIELVHLEVVEGEPLVALVLDHCRRDLPK